MLFGQPPLNPDNSKDRDVASAEGEISSEGIRFEEKRSSPRVQSFKIFTFRGVQWYSQSLGYSSSIGG